MVDARAHSPRIRRLKTKNMLDIMPIPIRRVQMDKRPVHKEREVAEKVYSPTQKLIDQTNQALQIRSTTQNLAWSSGHRRPNAQRVWRKLECIVTHKGCDRVSLKGQASCKHRRKPYLNL